MSLRRKRYRMDIGATVTAATNDDRAGDEAALEALNGSLTGLGTGWSSDMSLSDSIDGVTTDTIGEELRVTGIELSQRSLSGNFNNESFGNLKELAYLNFSFNSMGGNVPDSINNCTKLEYIYLAYSDDIIDRDPDPHLQSGMAHVGKNKGTEGNNFTGDFPDISNLTSLKWLLANFQSFTSLPDSVFNLPALQALGFYENVNISSRSIPSTIGNMTELTDLYIGVARGSSQWLTGKMPAEFGSCTKMKYLIIGDHEDFEIDFNTLDMSGMTDFRVFATAFTTMSGPFPAYFVDGTMPNFNIFGASFPRNSSGFTGNLPEFGTNNMADFNLGWGHDLTGEVPLSFWQESNVDLIDLTDNQLTGFGTDDISPYITGLRQFRWADNNLSGRWPNYDWSNASELNGSITFDGNRFVFADMLWIPSTHNPDNKTIFQLYSDHYATHGDNSFTYLEQQDFGSQDDYDSGTNTIDFSSILTHADNDYQWKRNGSNISGDSAILDVSGFDAGDEIDLEVTNPGVSGMTLTSVTITI